MSAENACPECGNLLSAMTKRCSCGWRKAEIKERTRADYRCWFAIAEQRCPLPGTINSGLSAWYCRRHKTWNDPQRGKAELLYIENNYQQIIEEEYTDWRRKLFN